MTTSTSTSTFSVRGMSCEHCVGAVSEEIASVPGVREVTVNLPGGLVTVSADGPIDAAAVRSAVEEAGYEVADGPLAG